jgi:chromate transporter
VNSGSSPPRGISFATAARYWLRLGCLSFGGPAGQIALLHRELVEERRWIPESSFIHALNYCMLLPGPEAQQLVTYAGWLLHGPRGGITAGVLFILPSLLLMLSLAWLYLRFGSIPWISGIFAGIKPAVTAIVIQAALRLGIRTLKTLTLRLIALTAFLALTWWKLPFPGVIAAAALVGALLGHSAPTRIGLPARPQTASSFTATGHSASSGSIGWGSIALVALLTWGLPLGALAWQWGWHGLPALLAVFFTKAALLTFGGAYAVLPYVYQGAIVEHAWVTPVQMMDGLALGESTPGPLIMVVAFVAFIAGYEQGPWADASPLLSGVLTGLLATWFTFLPSFFFILGGARWVERSQGNRRLAGPLTVISASVVGVIFNLGWFFARATLFDEGGLALWPCLVAVFAFCALQFLRWSMLRVLFACGMMGSLQQMLSA